MDKEALFDEVNLLYKKAEERRNIEPTHIKKYTGSILPNRYGSFAVDIKHREKLGRRIKGQFATYAEAFAFVKDINRQYKLPVRNRIRDYGIYMKVEMTNDRKMIFDHRNLKFVQEHSIFSQLERRGGSFYAVTKVRNSKDVLKCKKVHNLLKGYTPTRKITADHINRNSEDNREFNLRFVSRAVQTINQGIRRDNKTGITGVSYHKQHHCYDAFYSVDGKLRTKSFGVSTYGHAQAKQLAIEYRQKKIATIDAYIEAGPIQTVGIDMNENDVYDVSDDLEYRYETDIEVQSL